MRSKETIIHFDDHSLVRALLGVHDEFLKMIESVLGVTILAKGLSLKVIATHEHERETAEKILRELYSLLKNGCRLDAGMIERSLAIITSDKSASLSNIFLHNTIVGARGRLIMPKTSGQKAYLEEIERHDMVFGIGPAGTGKTYLAMASAVGALLRNKFDRIILTRPAVEAGEKLGFLPGDMQEKVNPYLRPLYDALHDMMSMEQAHHLIDEGRIEVAPLAFMRGRTLNNAFVILDEAQNCTHEQMKMFLTRLGYDSKVVITADVTQIDLPSGITSGALEVQRILKNVEGILFHYFTEDDVVRHKLVQAIIKAYNDDEKRQRAS